MKDFFNFLSEARVSKAAEKAKKLGLMSDGSGGWVDKQGNVQARTVGGELVFSQKKGPAAERERTGRVAADKEDPRTQTQQQAEPEVEKGEDEETDGDMKNGETITLVFGRFNPPTVGGLNLPKTRVIVSPFFISPSV